MNRRSDQPTDPMSHLVAVFPSPAPVDLARTLDLAGYRWKAVATPDDVAKSEPADGWAGAVVACDSDPEGGWAICRSLRKREISVGRILVLVTGAQLPDLELRDDLFDDFCLAPFHPRELEARLRHLFFTHHVAGHHSFVEYAGLVLNLETYQASFGGTPLDLTYMEYELLKFLAQNPGKVFSARPCSLGSGDTSTSVAHEPWTFTSAVCARSWAKSTPTSSRLFAASAIASASRSGRGS